MSEKRIAVGTTISRVISDNQLPNSVKSGVTKALLKDGDIGDYVLEEMVNNIGTRAERMYAYGRDRYTHGLPSGQFMTGAENIDGVVGAVLLGIEGAAVELDYVHHGAPNNLHIGWLKLMALHGYNPATNQLTGLTTTLGTPAYLHDMLVVVPQAKIASIETQSLEQWGIAARAGYTPQRQGGNPTTQAMILPSDIRADPVGVAEVLRVEYVWSTPTGVKQGYFLIPVTGYDAQADYFHIRYRVGGVAKYWMYRDGAGTYPTLDALFDTAPKINGNFFPFAYFRYNKSSEITNKTTQTYKTSKKLTGYMGLDFDTVAEAIDSNPGIADVDSAILMLAVPANTANEIERRYLWEFFNNLYLASSPEHRHRTEGEAELAALRMEQLGLRAPGIVIQDTRFKMSLDNLGIYKRRKAGIIGPVGSHQSSFGTRALSYPITIEKEVIEYTEYWVNINSHYYRRQVSKEYYDEIQVVGLRTLFHIYGGYSAVGEGDARLLIIPLDHSITQDFSIQDREVLYARSMHLVFNSLIVQKVKWYQTLLFQFVMIAVAIVITYITWGADGGTLLATAIAAGAYLLVAELIFIMVLEALIAKAIFKMFVKAVGIEAAFVIAIIAAAYGLGTSMNAGSVAGAPYADTLLSVASGLQQAIGAQIKLDMSNLLQQSAEQDLLQKEQTKLLDTAKELLENSSILSPFVIFGEKPDAFYTRTVHSGNIGAVSVSAISYFVENALKLPELSDSLGDTV